MLLKGASASGCKGHTPEVSSKARWPSRGGLPVSTEAREVLPTKYQEAFSKALRSFLNPRRLGGPEEFFTLWSAVGCSSMVFERPLGWGTELAQCQRVSRKAWQGDVNSHIQTPEAMARGWPEAQQPQSHRGQGGSPGRRAQLVPPRQHNPRQN